MDFFESAEGKWFRQLPETSLVEQAGMPLYIDATVVAKMCKAHPKSAQVAMQILAQQLSANLKGKSISEAEDVAVDQRLVLGTLFHSYCVVSYVEDGIPLGIIPQEIRWVIEEYPIIMECARFVSEHNIKTIESPRR